MARPRIFISSTFYDLRQVRDDLERSIRANEEYVHRNTRVIRVQAMYFPSMGFLMGISALLVLWLGSRDVVASLRGRPSGAAPGAAGDEVEHFLLDPPHGAPADANRLRKLRGVHQHVDG